MTEVVIVDAEDVSAPAYDVIDELFPINLVTGFEVGTHMIVPAAFLSPNFTVSYELGTLTILKRTLVVKAEDTIISAGDALPEFNAIITGFTYDDDTTITDGPYFSVSPTYNGASGNYQITSSGLLFDNMDEYVVVYEDGLMQSLCNPQLSNPSCGIGVSFDCTSRLTLPNCINQTGVTWNDQDIIQPGTQLSTEYTFNNFGQELLVQTTTASSTVSGVGQNIILGAYSKVHTSGYELLFELCDVRPVGSGLHFDLIVTENTADTYSGSDNSILNFRDDYPVGTQITVSLEFYSPSGSAIGISGCPTNNLIGLRDMYEISITQPSSKTTTYLDYNEKLVTLKAYPNPFNNMLYIEAAGHIEVYNATGQRMYNGEATAIDASQWTTGMYIIRCEDQILKIIKK